MKGGEYPFSFKTVSRCFSSLRRLFGEVVTLLALSYRHQTSHLLTLGWTVGLKVQILVGVGWLSVDGDVYGVVSLPLEVGVEEWEGSILLQLQDELYRWSDTVQVAE